MFVAHFRSAKGMRLAQPTKEQNAVEILRRPETAATIEQLPRARRHKAVLAGWRALIDEDLYPTGNC
jgi:hypothetical protein